MAGGLGLGPTSNPGLPISSGVGNRADVVSRTASPRAYGRLRDECLNEVTVSNNSAVTGAAAPDGRL